MEATAVGAQAVVATAAEGEVGAAMVEAPREAAALEAAAWVVAARGGGGEGGGAP